MPTEILEEPKIETPLCDMSKLKALVNDAVKDTVHSANQALKGARHVAEDFIEDAQHTVKQKPFQSVGIAFAAGILAGGVLAWLGLRRR